MNITPYTRKVQYYENDPMGVVHHANYIRWFEEARVDYLDKLGFGYEKSVAAGIDFAVLGVSCEYKTMARFGDTVRIHMSVSHIDGTRMTITYRVEDAVTDEVRVTGESRHCYYHNEKKRPVSLKKALPELYALLLAEAEAPAPVTD